MSIKKMSMEDLLSLKQAVQNEISGRVTANGTCVHCGKHLSQTSGHNKIYCSRKCATYAWRKANPEKYRLLQQQYRPPTGGRRGRPREDSKPPKDLYFEIERMRDERNLKMDEISKILGMKRQSVYYGYSRVKKWREEKQHV